MKRTLEIGALCPSISKQLAGLISSEDAATLDRDNDAINRCYVMGYIPDSVTDRARKKLLAKCQKAVARRSDANKTMSRDAGADGASKPLNG